MFRLVAVLFCLVGCGGATPAGSALERASKELGCAKSGLKVQELRNGDYRVLGCEALRDYDCVESGWTMPVMRGGLGDAWAMRQDGNRGIPTEYTCVERATFSTTLSRSDRAAVGGPPHAPAQASP
jgi:hypothetical protein